MLITLSGKAQSKLTTARRSSELQTGRATLCVQICLMQPSCIHLLIALLRQWGPNSGKLNDMAQNVARVVYTST